MRMLYRVLPALVLLSSLLAGVLAQPDATTCDESAGEITRVTYDSAVLQQAMYYTVYTPPCYDPDSTYPVIYLMHGSNEDDGHWVRLKLPELLDQSILDGTAPPLIAIFPFGNVIANRNQFDTVSWNNIFLTELIPHAESRYSVADDPTFRAIGGISRGGFWAYQIGLRHPDLFGAIGGHSAYFDRYHAPDDFNPLDLALSSTTLDNQRLWLDRGGNDYAAPGIEIMHENLASRGAVYIYERNWEGQHHNSYWSQHIEDYVRWYVEPWLDASPATDELMATVAPLTAFATNTPMVTPQPTATQIPFAPTDTATRNGLALYVPIVAFPSLATSISLEDLAHVALGGFDARLRVTDSALAELTAINVSLHPDTRIIADNALRSTLWGDRDAYALVPFDDVTLDYRVLWMDDAPLVDQLGTYPFAFERGTPNFNADRLTRLTLSGVTAITRRTTTVVDEKGVEWTASGIRDYVTASDFFHTSNEVSILDTYPQSSGVVLGAPAFCTKPEHAELLNLIELDIVELSGNHNNDYGYDPYLDTLEFYRSNNIATIGGGETPDIARTPHILDHNGTRIGMLACNVPGPYYAHANDDPTRTGGVRPGAADCDWNWLEQAIPALAEQVDLVTVTVQHWEFEQYTPTPAQRVDFRRLANLGADVVMGTHAHKPQTYEFYTRNDGQTAVLHYGMGNLFFDQPWWGNSRFFMNTLYLYDGRLLFVEVFPGIIEEQARPRLMTPEERENFLFFMFRQQNGF